MDRMPKYVVNAMKVVASIKGVEDLPAVPPTVVDLPTSGSMIVQNCLQKICKDIDACLDIEGISEESKGHLTLVVFFLGRFLFLSPVRENGGRGGTVGVYNSVQVRLRLFTTDDGPEKLWKDHLKVAAFLASVANLDSPHDSPGPGPMGDRKKLRVESSIMRGDLHFASKELFSEFKMLHYITEEEARSSFYELYNPGDVEDKALTDEIREVLAQAVAEGDILSPMDEGYEALLSITGLRSEASSYVKSLGPDVGGWRPYHLKLCLGFGGKMADLIARVCNDIVSGSVPAGASWVPASSRFFVLQHTVKVDKQRKISPPISAWASLSNGAFMHSRKAEIKENVAPLQMAVGMSGGVDICSHLSMLLNSTGAEAISQNEKCLSVQGDLDGFFYKQSRRAWVQALIDAKDFLMLRAAVAQFADPGGVVVASTIGRQNVVLPNPVNGLPVGHPFSPYLATLAVTRTYKSALAIVTRGDPAAKRRYEKNLSIKAYMDDFRIFGVYKYMLNLLREFVPMMIENGVARFKPEKTMAESVPAFEGDKRVLTACEIKSLDVALHGDRAEQEAFFGGQGRPNTRRSVHVGGSAQVPGVGSGMKYGIGESGTKFLGGYSGPSEYLVGVAESLIQKLEQQISQLSELGYKNRLTMLSYLGSKYTHLAGQNGCTSEFNAVWEAVDQSTIKMVRVMCGALEPQDTVQVPFVSRWRETQSLLVVAPVRGDNGLGYASMVDKAPFSFLSKFLRLAEFLKAEESDSTVARKALQLMWEDADGSPYARMLHDVKDRFLALFANVNGRSPSKDEDGFDFLTLESLPPAAKFQRAAKKLCDKFTHTELVDQIPAHEKAQWLATAPPGSISWFTALCFKITDADVSTLLQFRLLMTNVGGFKEGDKCPGNGCNKKTDMDAAHGMGCVHIGPKARYAFLHECLRKQVHELLKFSRVGFDPEDLTVHRGILKRLRDAGKVRLGVQGVQKGGDILALNVMGEPGQLSCAEMALDVTTTSKIGTVADPLSELKRLEVVKYDLYNDMYKAIGVETVGLAMDAYGNMSPNLIKLIEKCEQYRGVGWAFHLPSWASWRCRTFKRAWMTRFVVFMQVAAASKMNFAAAAVARIRARKMEVEE